RALMRRREAKQEIAQSRQQQTDRDGDERLITQAPPLMHATAAAHRKASSGTAVNIAGRRPARETDSLQQMPCTGGASPADDPTDRARPPRLRRNRQPLSTE